MENPTTPRAQDRTDQVASQRERLRARHASALAKLMQERSDLQGTYAFADLVSDALRWSA